MNEKYRRDVHVDVICRLCDDGAHSQGFLFHRIIYVSNRLYSLREAGGKHGATPSYHKNSPVFMNGYFTYYNQLAHHCH